MPQLPSFAPRVCPSWCHADHSHQIRPIDEVHWGEIGSLAATELVTTTDGLDSYQRSVQIDVGVEQATAAGSVYVSVVLDDELSERSMLITADSALRLSHALARAVAATSA